MLLEELVGAKSVRATISGLTSRPGMGAMARDSNIAQTATIAAMAMALYTNQSGLAKSIAEQQSRRLISVQINATGAVYRDAPRPNGFMYVSGVLVDFLDLARASSMAGLNVNLLEYQANSTVGSISLALDWFLPFCMHGCMDTNDTVAEQKACADWPYDQIEDVRAHLGLADFCLLRLWHCAIAILYINDCALHRCRSPNVG